MNWRTEVGTRLVPVFADTEDDARRRQQVTMAAGSVDDLDESGSIDEMVWVTQCRGVGYVVHLYFYSLGDWGELEDVVTVWTGTDDDEPVILN